MYYLITIRVKEHEQNCRDFDYDCVVFANSIDGARKDFDENHDDYEELVDVHEITAEERIERQQKIVCDRILRACYSSLKRHIENSARWQRWLAGKEGLLDDRTETEYLLLQVYAQIHQIKKIVDRQPGVENLTIKEYEEVIYKVMDAQTEEEINDALNSIRKRR